MTHLLHQVRITRIVDETINAKTFILEPLHGWQPVYQPGQFLTLVFFTRHGEKRRSYSISSIIALDEPLCITVKKVDNGEFSRLLLGKAKEGDVLYCAGVSGMFVLPDAARLPGQLFFLAAGSGITPCFALIKFLLATSQTNIVLIYSNRSREETIFQRALEHLQLQYSSRFVIHYLFSDEMSLQHSRLNNWLLQQLVEQLIRVPLHEVLFYLCGPFDYMQMITIGLLSQGVPQLNIRKENFSTLPRLLLPAPPDRDQHRVSLHFRGVLHQLEVKFPQSILSVAKANGIDLPYSCEAGRCGSCVAICIQGKIWMAYNEVLTDDEVQNGRILCCQAFPVETDAEIVV